MSPGEPIERGAGRASSEPVPAATVVLGRDGRSGLEVLMVRRAPSGAFAGMWVFPGGRVDPDDLDPVDPGDEIAAARRAAVREAAEETTLVVDPATLVTFSHWLPPPRLERRFSTWFFLAPAPDEPTIRLNPAEHDDHRWWAPIDALSARDAGVVALVPPTWVTLDRLARASTAQDALDRARGREPDRFLTEIAVRNRNRVAFWPGDAAWPDGDLERPGPRRRLWMDPTGWRFEDTTDDDAGER